MSEKELRKAIEELAHDGDIEENYNPEKQDHEYNLTDTGVERVESMLKEKPDAQLFMFQLFWNDEMGSSWGEGLEKLVRIAVEMRDRLGVNIIRTLWEHRDKIEGGFEFKERPPEDFLKKFD